MTTDHVGVHPARAGSRHAAGRVSVCFDPRDDVAVIRAVHARCAAGGQVALSPGPEAAAADTLALSLACALGVLWRVPRRLRNGRGVFSDDNRAQVEWEISWALHRDGIGVLWVLDAGRVGLPGWRWLHRLAVRERLHVVLLVARDPPDRWQAAALQGGASPQLLAPERLHPGPETPPWWHRPGPPSTRRANTAGLAQTSVCARPVDVGDADDISAGRGLSQFPLGNTLAQQRRVGGFR